MVYINESINKQYILEKLNAQLKEHEKKLKNYQHQIDILEKKKRTKLLILAGEVIEKAGLLKIYDRNKLLNLLIKNKKLICDKSSSKSVKSKRKC